MLWCLGIRAMAYWLQGRNDMVDRCGTTELLRCWWPEAEQEQCLRGKDKEADTDSKITLHDPLRHI